jgi:hypothetical protein
MRWRADRFLKGLPLSGAGQFTMTATAEHFFGIWIWYPERTGVVSIRA